MLGSPGEQADPAPASGFSDQILEYLYSHKTLGFHLHSTDSGCEFIIFLII